MFFPCIITTYLYSLISATAVAVYKNYAVYKYLLIIQKQDHNYILKITFKSKKLIGNMYIFYHVEFLWIQTYVFFNKILNVLYLNKKFFRLNRISWPLCSFCQFENETPIHLSPGCIKTNLHWYKLKNL